MNWWWGPFCQQKLDGNDKKMRFASLSWLRIIRSRGTVLKSYPNMIAMDEFASNSRK